jgi:pyrroline-5-carboxylate reductase
VDGGADERRGARLPDRLPPPGRHCGGRGEREAGRQERLDELAERYGVETTLANAETVQGADVVIIAVKPQDIDILRADVGSALAPSQTVLSIAAAIPTALIERHVGDAVPVVRAMPNTPVTVHEGMAGVAAGAHAGEEDLALASQAALNGGRRRADTRPRSV